MKGTWLTLVNATSVNAGTITALGTYVGLRNARLVSIFFRGSYKTSGGTPAQLEIFPACAPSPGSIDTAKIGSIVLATGVSAVKQRSKSSFGSVDLSAFPYIVAQVRHRTGTAGLGPVLARAFVKTE